MLSGCNNMDPVGDKNKNNLILRQMAKMNLTGAGVGWADLKGCFGGVAASGRNGSLAWVNCNLNVSGKPMFREFVAILNNGVRYGITSAVSPARIKSPMMDGLAQKVTALPAPESAIKEAKKYWADTDVFIVLSDMTPEEENRLAEHFPAGKALLIVGSNGRQGPDSTRWPGKTSGLNPGEQGRQAWEIDYEPGTGRFQCTKVPVDSGVANDQETAAAVDIYWRVHERTGVPQKASGKQASETAIRILGNRDSKALTFFYSPKCGDCREFMENDLARAESLKLLAIQYVDITDLKNYEVLRCLQQRTGVQIREIPVAFYAGKLYDGKEMVDDLLKRVLDEK